MLTALSIHSSMLSSPKAFVPVSSMLSAASHPADNLFRSATEGEGEGEGEASPPWEAGRGPCLLR